MSERVPPYRIPRRTTQPEPAPEPTLKQKRAERLAEKLPPWKRQRAAAAAANRRQEQALAENKDRIERLQARLRYFDAAPFEMQRQHAMAVEAASHGNKLVNILTNARVPQLREDLEWALESQHQSMLYVSEVFKRGEKAIAAAASSEAAAAAVAANEAAAAAHAQAYAVWQHQHQQQQQQQQQHPVAAADPKLKAP